MSRLHTGIALAAIAAVATGCSTFSNTDTAATVDGVDISEERVERVLGVFADNAELTRLTEDTSTGTVDAAAVRTYLGWLVNDVAADQYLAQNGEAISDEDRSAITADIPDDDPLMQFPDDVLELLIDQLAGRQAFGRIAAADGLQERYEASPGDVGVFCVSHVLSESEADARDVLADLEAGADFADVATERSTDPSAAQNGGAIAGQDGSPCLAIDDAQAGLDPDFVAAALQATPGTPTEPVETSFGWHVILVRPWSEVGETVSSVVGTTRFAEYVRGLDVTVDPRYGRWDPETASIVTLS